MMKVVYLLLTVLFVSCSNLSLETDSIVVNAIAKGKVLSSGDFFDVSFNKSSESVIVNPTSADVEIILKNSSRNEVYVEPIVFIIDIQENPNPRFQITSDFLEGVYDINIVVYEQESIISEYNSEFIVYSGVLGGDISALYPLENMYSGSKILLESDIHYSDYIDPYLVWSFDGEIFEEGSLSEGYDSVVWDTVNRNGFMDIDLDIYPYKLSSVTIGSDSFVDFSFIVNPLDTELYDSILLSHYYKLLFFNGNYIDEIDKYRDIDFLQEMIPEVVDGCFGMKIGETLGFITYDSMFPQDIEASELESFSLLLNIKPLSLENGSIIRNIHGDLKFSLYLEDGILKSSYGLVDGDLSITDISDLTLDGSLNLTISFVKCDSGYNMFYYIGGELVTSSEWLFFQNEQELESELYSSFEVGGNDDLLGLCGILDDVKIYYRDDLGNNNIYPNNLLDSFDNSINFDMIIGFNSIYNPLNFSGVGFSNGETLYMESDSYITYAELLPLDMDYVLTIGVESSEGYALTIYKEDQEPLVRELFGSCIVKKKGDTLFVDDEMITLWSSESNNFAIQSLGETILDFITLESMDMVVEIE